MKIVLLLLLLFLSYDANSRDLGSKWISARAFVNKTYKKDYWSINPDCTSRGETVIRILQSPSHGRLEIKNTIGKIKYKLSGPRHCNSTPVAVSRLIYIPNQGYIGKDHFQVEAFFPRGDVKNYRFFVDIVQ